MRRRTQSIASELFLNWWGSYRDSFFFVFLPIAAGMFFVLWQSELSRPRAGLWALACLAAGSLVGFIFGVPRAVQEGNSTTDQSGQAAKHYAPVIRANTNLERVSDWLTKAIIGVGLVELKKIPGLVERGASYVVGHQPSLPGAESTAAALIVLFSAVGFIGGYVNTRLFFSVAFSRADSLSRKDSENEIEEKEAERPNTAAQPDGSAVG